MHNIFNIFPGVEKANLLTVTSINKTSIRVSLPVTWDYNYERTAICYSFNIKVNNIYFYNF